jgi:hypothetical protein
MSSKLLLAAVTSLHRCYFCPYDISAQLPVLWSMSYAIFHRYPTSWRVGCAIMVVHALPAYVYPNSHASFTLPYPRPMHCIFSVYLGSSIIIQMYLPKEALLFAARAVAARNLDVSTGSHRLSSPYHSSTLLQPLINTVRTILASHALGACR